MFEQFPFHFPKRKPGGKTAPGRRVLGFESLESRELLSVSPLTYPIAPEYDYRDSDWFEQIMENQTVEPTGEGAIENEWIVQLTDDALSSLYSVSVAAVYFDNYGISVIGGLGSAGMLHVSMADGTTELQSEVLAGLNCFEFWEQNYAWENTAITNDTYVSAQWYLETLGVEAAWQQSTGDNVVVAVLDTGIQLDHPDLQANIWTNPGEIAGDGIDNDGNGFIDDVNGWDFNHQDNNVSDIAGHGVMVSGVIGAIGNNSYGTIGVAPETTLLPLRAGETMFPSNAVIAGINYAIQLKTDFGINICAINASMAGIRDSRIFTSVIELAGAADILIITSAGNEANNNDLNASYNNRYDNVIVVAATDQNDNLSSFSNYGSVSVDLAAPGSNIYTSDFETGAVFGIGVASGTSVAAPMVTAAAALIASVHPDWSAAQIKEAILATVDVLPSLDGKVATGGRLNIAAAVAYDPAAYASAPDAPSDLSVVKMSDGTLQFKWTDNSRNETSFELQYSLDGGAWTTAQTGIAKNSTATTYSPTAVGSFQFQVRAVNQYGNSAWSTAVSIQTDSLPIPATPTGLAATTVGEAIKLTWNTVSDVTGYRLERSLNGSDWTEIYEGTLTTFSDSDLQANTLYYYRVFSVNDQSVSAASSMLVQRSPSLLPETPDGLTLDEVTSTSVRLIWSDSKYATEYIVQRQLTYELNWTTIATTTVATYTDNTVKASTSYSYRIIASNGVQQSDPVTTALRTPAPTPPESPPGSVVAVAESDKIVNLSWDAVPGATSYIVERSTDGTTWKKITTVKNATTYQNKSLAAATTYYYRVSSSGLSVTTEPSDVVTVKTKLATTVVPTVKVTSSAITITDAGTLTITPTKTTPAGLYYYIEYTCAVDAKNKADWGQSIIEKVSGTTHQFETTLTPGTQYFVRVVATETDYALADLPAWSSLSNVGLGKETKFKTKAVPLAKITTSGYAMSAGGEFGVKIRITTPAQNDNAKNPVLPAGTTFSYQIIVAGSSSKVDKTTGLLTDGVNLGTIALTETVVKNKTYFDSSLILFSDIARIGDLTSMKTVQIQLLVTYTASDGTVIATVPTKVTKLTLPKWFA